MMKKGKINYLIVTITYLLCFTLNMYSQVTVKIKSISDSDSSVYKITNGKIISKQNTIDGTLTYVYNKIGLLTNISNRIFFTYNADGTFASKKTIYQSNPNHINNQTHLFTYSPNLINEKIYKSSNLNVIIEEINYGINNNLIVFKNYVGKKITETFKYDNRGNLIFWRYENVLPNGNISYSDRNYTYDENPSINNLIFTGFFGSKTCFNSVLFGGIDNFPSENNVLSIVYTSNKSFNQKVKTNIINFSYTYDLNRYPASVSENNGSSNFKNTIYKF